MTDTTDAPQPAPPAHPAANAAAGRWVLDPAGSAIRFASRTFWGLATVRGTFGSVTGEGEVLPGGAAHGTLTVRTATLDTKNGKRDTHLRSADFFACDDHPELVFTARTVTPAAGGTVEIAGDLTIRGTSRPLTFTARVTADGPDGRAVTLDAETTVRRDDFGMTWNQLGMLKDPATVTVTARFVTQD